ncbi:cytochrome oxidase [Rhodanobacter lindaniclasticus]
MVLQNVIWVITLTGMGLVALGFVYAIAQAGRPAEADEAARAHRSSTALRRGLFLALLLLGIGIAWASLRPFPIPLQHGPLQAAQVVDVVGHQWTWDVSPTQLTAGQPVEFRVTASDVNHGFAIYAPDGRIVTQTQAMPGFTNKLLYTFHTPGTYRIMCLEYCGVAHNGMTAELQVAAAGDQP